MSLPYPYLLKGDVREDIYSLHSYLNALIQQFENSSVEAVTPALDTKAASSSSFITSSADILLPNARVLTDTATIDFDVSVAGVASASIPDAAITTAKLATDSVTTVKITNSNVTTAKIADVNVTTAKLADGAVTTVKVTDANITAAKLATDSVTTAKIVDANVTLVKLADYSEGNFTITGTGFTVNPTATAKYVKMGKQVSLYIPTLTGTSNATTFTLTGLPAAVTPTLDSYHVLLAVDNGANIMCTLILVGASTTVYLYGFVAVWTASGTKTLYNCCLSYILV